MYFRLYKNCIVKDSYAEVFSPSVFESYLSTLDSFVWEVIDSYATLNGSIQLEYSEANGPFDYNYMKIVNVDGRIYYAFITRVEIVGEDLAVVYYKTDIWHTFISGCQQRNSIIVNSKATTADDFAFLPVEYETLSPWTWSSSLNSATHFSKVKLIVEFQTYDLVSSQSGQQSEDKRQTFVAFMTKGRSLKDNVYTLSEAEFAIQELINNSSGQNLTTLAYNATPLEGFPENWLQLATGDRWYSIVNVYMIPASWGEEIYRDYATSITFKFKQNDNYYFWLMLSQEGGNPVYPEPGFRPFMNITVPNDYKNIAVGVFSNPVNIINNGKESTLKLLSCVDAFNFNLMMEFQGAQYDITPFYKVELPFTSINGETAQLRRIADQEKLMNAVAKITGSTIKAAGKGLSAVKGQSSGTPGDTTAGRAGSLLSAGGTWVQDVWTGVNAIVAASAEKYQTTYEQNIDIVGAINAYYGIMLFKKDNTYNDAEVQYAINNVGYQTQHLVEVGVPPYNPYNLSTGYNPIKYGYINLYGSCPQNIISQLEAIFLRGVKIYYQKEV